MMSKEGSEVAQLVLLLISISCIVSFSILELLTRTKQSGLPAPGPKKSRDECKALLAGIPDGAPKGGELWTHFRGAEHRVLGLALDADSIGPLVIYYDVGDMDVLWARSLEDWMSNVETAEGPVARFTRVSDAYHRTPAE